MAHRLTSCKPLPCTHTGAAEARTLCGSDRERVWAEEGRVAREEAAPQLISIITQTFHKQRHGRALKESLHEFSHTCRPAGILSVLRRSQELADERCSLCRSHTSQRPGKGRVALWKDDAQSAGGLGSRSVRHRAGREPVLRIRNSVFPRPQGCARESCGGPETARGNRAAAPGCPTSRTSPYIIAATWGPDPAHCPPQRALRLYLELFLPFLIQ